MGQQKAVLCSENWCPTCRRVLPKTKFYEGLGIQNPNVLPICRECCKTKLEKYGTIVGEFGAGWMLCAELGIPYISEKWKSSTTVNKSNITRGRLKTDLLYYYIKGLRDGDTVYQGFCDSDATLDELRGNQKVSNSILITDMNDLESLVAKWGRYDDHEVYIYLENTLAEYTDGIFDIDANLLARYKDLCILEYQKRKAQEAGDLGEISKAQDAVSKQLKLLKLDDFQVNVRSEEEKHIERICWEIENTRPAECEDLEKYKDFSGFGATMEHIMRCCKNLVSGSKEYPDLERDTK